MSNENELFKIEDLLEWLQKNLVTFQITFVIGKPVLLDYMYKGINNKTARVEGVSLSNVLLATIIKIRREFNEQGRQV